MQKPTLTVTTPYGTFSRKTGRHYTHVVVGCGTDADYLRGLVAKCEQKYGGRAKAEAYCESWLKHMDNAIANNLRAKNENEVTRVVWTHSLELAESVAGREHLNVVGIFPVGG